MSEPSYQTLKARVAELTALIEKMAGEHFGHGHPSDKFWDRIWHEFLEKRNEKTV